MIVGIPRALTYYAYFPLWHNFLQELGCEILISQKTSKLILDNGVHLTVNDACIPIKVFHGHVYELKDKVDFIFIPRLLNLTGERNVTYCPKFLGLADMVNASIDNLPAILDPQIDMRQNWKERYTEFARIGGMLGINPVKVARAFKKAIKHMSLYKKNISQRLPPHTALSVLTENNSMCVPRSDALTLAIVGYPYLLFDSFINSDLLNRLADMGVKMLTPEMVTEKDMKRHSHHLPKDLFWTFSNQVYRSALYYMNKTDIAGLIHVTAFGCGPDAMVGKLIELDAKQRYIPFISISVDEHTGEGGIVTRLEAFVDMLNYRRDMI